MDSVYEVDHLDERLKLAFGEESVFRDASSIGRRAVFPQSIRDALAVAKIYRLRWRIELFFRWIMGHLRIQHY